MNGERVLLTKNGDGSLHLVVIAIDQSKPLSNADRERIAGVTLPPAAAGKLCAMLMKLPEYKNYNGAIHLDAEIEVQEQVTKVLK